MNKSITNIALIGASLILAGYIYKRYISKSTRAKIVKGTLSSCEEIASTMKFSSEVEKLAWISECFKADASDESLKSPAPDSIMEQKCIEAASSLRFTNETYRRTFISDCVRKAGGV